MTTSIQAHPHLKGDICISAVGMVRKGKENEKEMEDVVDDRM